MSEITTIGLDLAKHVFQVHGIDPEGTTVLRRRLRRNQVLAFRGTTAANRQDAEYPITSQKAPALPGFNELS
jgi:hypothetical protein